MKRRITALVLAVMMVMGTVAAAAGMEKTVTVTPMALNVNGQTVTPLKSDGTPAEVFAYEGATYAPLRYLSELGGSKVIWDANDPNTAKIATDAAYTNDWDGVYDVVVVGYGGAGAVTAITAADKGAKVLVLEKAPKGEEGGNTRVSGQQILSPNDPVKAETYFRAMQGNYAVDDEIVTTWATKMCENKAWVEQMGGEGVTEIVYPEYPELPGSEAMTCALVGGVRSTGLFWKLLAENVEKRDIDVLYATPGTELIQDNAGAVVGVVAEQEGKELRFYANGGVVLACGGFENNQEMIQTYLHLPYGYPKGTVYNTGDGITMAMEVGAQLWNMSNPAGPDLNFKAPDRDSAFGYSLATTSLFTRGAIIVGADGTRFINEAYSARHGKVPFSGNFITNPVSLPAYLIFDEAARTAGPIYASWSKDNSEEVEKGWIVKADTLAELAEKLDLPEGSLDTTVENYNVICKAGEDPLGRAAEKLTAIGKGPYYAMELVPSFTNPQGGPKRNAQCEVISTRGQAIPGLYSAGELGSFHVHGYNGGGTVGECIMTGRIAGENAAAAKTGRMVLPLAAITVKQDNGPDIATSAGEYVGVSHNGMGGDVYVKVTMDGGKIAKVEVVEQHETVGIGDKAIAALPDAIVKAGSTEVDNVSGATITSKAIKEAVADALSQVK